MKAHPFAGDLPARSRATSMASRTTWPRLLLFLLIAAATAGAGPTPPPPLSFAPVEVDNQFPDSLTFSATITSDSARVSQAWLVFYIGDELATPIRQRVPVEVSPGQQVEVSYRWDTSTRTVVPGTPIVYWWEAEDSSGNPAMSEALTVRYEDVRFDWQVRADDDLSVWWHDRPASLGDQVYDISRGALEDQAGIYQTSLTFPIRVMIYNDFAEFAAFHASVEETIGGEAFAGLGITLQIVPLNIQPDAWLSSVLPHEISHLYFAQVTYHPAVSVPSWIDEGMAMHAEPVSQSGEVALARAAAERNDLTPLTALTGSFGPHDEGRFRLAYAESYTAVAYMLEIYGRESVANLLAAYRQGEGTEAAFQSALGVTLGEFQHAWAQWLGATLPFPPTPTALVWPTADPPPTPSDKAQATRTPVPPATWPASATPTPEPPNAITTIPCGGIALPLSIVGLAMGLTPSRGRSPQARSKPRRREGTPGEKGTE